jgi:hypothetical protein
MMIESAVFSDDDTDNVFMKAPSSRVSKPPLAPSPSARNAASPTKNNKVEIIAIPNAASVRPRSVSPQSKFGPKSASSPKRAKSPTSQSGQVIGDLQRRIEDIIEKTARKQETVNSLNIEISNLEKKIEKYRMRVGGIMALKINEKFVSKNNNIVESRIMKSKR